MSDTAAPDATGTDSADTEAGRTAHASGQGLPGRPDRAGRGNDAPWDASFNFRTALDAMPDGVLVLTPDLRIVWVNELVLKRYGGNASKLHGRHCYELHHHRADPCHPCPVQRSFVSGHPEAETVSTPDGKFFELRTVPLRGIGGEVQSVLEVGRDVTDHLQLEEKLRQSQKMDAIGQLAGGVAHDFNNVLTIIGASCSFLQEDLPADSKSREDVATILKATDSAASLTRQLLAFSRQQAMQVRPLDFNRQVRQADRWLKRLLGEDISVVLRLADEVDCVLADPGQVEQIILNLAVNARDAMPQGGCLTIETANVKLDETFVAHNLAGKPGPHVVLSVSDTGCGMDAATQARVFEPFFTTKALGKGTGLGLATVYGIVGQMGGVVTVQSQVAWGTQFFVYIPRAEAASRAEESRSVLSTASSGGETILIVEDDREVRALAARVLRGASYVVLEADGLEQASQHADTRARIDLVLSDVIMPGGSGKAVAETVRRAHPSARVIFTSGYTDEAIDRYGVLELKLAFLPKPFSAEELTRKVRGVLDGSS